jgi:hypothetical protein
MMTDILVGAGASVLGGLVVGGAMALRRLWRTPQRLDRIERLVPALLRAVQALLIVQRDCGAGNGAVQDSLEELQQLVTNGAVSQRETR